MNKKIIITSIILLGTFLYAKNILFTTTSRSEQQDSIPLFYISQVIEHPALNATVQGIKDELTKTGKVVVDCAQGQPAIAAQIAAYAINQNPTMVIGVGTLSAQSFLKYISTTNIPLIFSSVTDPRGAKITTETNVNKVFGVSNFIPLAPQLELFKKIQPNLKNLGIIYNPSELNSITIINELEKICPKYNITLIKQPLINTSDAMQVTTYLANQVDAIFISNDNTALAALQTIIAVGLKNKIPTYVSDTDAVELGALAALGPDQYQIGRQTGAMIIQLLEKKSVQNIEYPNSIELFLNKTTAKKLGITFSNELVSQAKEIIEKGDA